MNYSKLFYSALLFLLLTGIANSQTFTKIITGPFVNDGGASRSVNFIDYNGDGSLDLFISNGKRFGQNNFLYSNISGNYSRVLGIRVVTDSLPYDGASWADFDNDGDLDMCIVTWYDSTNMLYRNEGSSFTLLESSPVVTNRGFSETCSWGDFDNDGLVDLFVTNSAGSGRKNWLYRNTAGGNFVRIDTGVIASDINRFSRGVNWIDIDGDRDQDLFICNEENQSELMYKNNGDGYFTKITGIAPVSSGGHSWSASWGDYDNDGDFDLFYTNWGNQTNKLFKNDGDFNFTQVTGDTIVNEPGNFACSGWGDYDNDGDIDMFVTQAYGNPNIPLKNALYKNKLMETGTAGFERITAGDIVNEAGNSYGFAWGDWDADGDLDLFTANTFNENENNDAFLNGGNSNKWLEIKCIGTTSNRSGIGAKVRIKAIINGNPVWQVREVSGQSGYCAQNLDLHFGLGNASVIDSIRVEWPSNITQHFTGVQVNKIFSINETTGIIGINKLNENVPKEFNLYQNYPNPFNPSTKIKFEVKSASFVKIEVFDINGRIIEIIVNGELNPGTYEAEWIAGKYSSGAYFYRMETGGKILYKKMMLVK